ncbi:MAG: hypothetical protein VB144_07550 [Clostridia bacterium]|nr:hypothetical protein [Clostridia bacterium]
MDLLSVFIALLVVFSVVVRVLKTIMEAAESDARRKAGARGTAPQAGPVQRTDRAPVQSRSGQGGPSPAPQAPGGSLEPSGTTTDWVEGSAAEEQPEAAFEMSEEGPSEPGLSVPRGDDLRDQMRAEWNRDRMRTWDMPADVGSLGPVGEPADEPIARAAGLAPAPDSGRSDEEALPGADLGDDDAGPSRSDAWSADLMLGPDAATAGEEQVRFGMVWGMVLGTPRCRSRARLP